MKWFLLFTLGSTGALIVLACIVVLLVRHRLRRMNRVRPAVATDASMLWLISPQAAPRLHRRLVSAAASARLVAAQHQPTNRKARRRPAEPLPIVQLCRNLEVQAEGLDRHLVLAARLPSAQRRVVLLRVGQGVSEVERTAARLSVMSAEIAAPRVLPQQPGGVAEIGERLDDLEAANGDLRALEAGAGLEWSSPFTSGTEREPVALPRLEWPPASSHLAQEPPRSTSR